MSVAIPPGQHEDGFSLVELLVAIALFSVLSVGFYSALFSGVDGSDTTRGVVRISEEARGGFNRMIRDTREAESFVEVSPNSYRIQTDFDGDSVFESPNQAGDYEDLTFTFVAGQIRLSTPTLPAGEVLVRGVEQVAGRDVFTYSSNLLEFSGGDGVTTCLELDAALSPAVGNDSGTCDEGEIPYLSNVSYAFIVRDTDGGAATSFFSEAQLRNRR